jgi:enterochelin esterase family protein
MLAGLISMIEPTGCFPDARTGDGRPFDGRHATRTTTMANPDKFAHIGLFSGGSIGMSEVTKPAEFKKQVKVVFLGNGRADGGARRKQTQCGGAQERRHQCRRHESPRTANEFLTWRRCLHEFAPLLFK